MSKLPLDPGQDSQRPCRWHLVKVHVLQHVPFEGVGSIHSWLTQRRASVSYTRFYEKSALPEIADVDLVIAMGGPMSVNDEVSLPWLKDEKRFILQAVQAGRPVVGICLGAQLIAGALGARVYPAPCKEIGWFPIESTSDAAGLFRFPKTVPVFHWHGETFDLPPGSTKLARSAGCENQAFQVGSNVIGLQFHLETTPESASAIMSHCRNELIEDVYVQPEAAMRGMSAAAYERINRLMGEVLSYVTRTDDRSSEAAS